jgi:hypothetical protein
MGNVRWQYAADHPSPGLGGAGWATVAPSCEIPPLDIADLTNKEYVDSINNLYDVMENGHTASTDLDMATYSINDVSRINLNLSNTYDIHSGTSIIGSIGYIYQVPQVINFADPNSYTFTSNQSKIFGSLDNVPAGVFYVTAVMTVKYNEYTAYTFTQASISGQSSTNINNRMAIPSEAAMNNNTLYHHVSGVIVNTTPCTIQCSMYISFATSLGYTTIAVDVGGYLCTITRIA